MNLVNRYRQLLASIPSGDFYASDGQVLPFKGVLPYDLRVNTGVPSRSYDVYINDTFSVSITTDITGVASLTTPLFKGRNDIRLIDPNTSESVVTYITTRDYATQLAALAEVTESIDSGVEGVLLDSRLATVSALLIEQVFGKTVNTGNSFGYDIDTYRELLSELRSAYRNWGGVVEGMSRVVRAFTQVSPLILPSGFGPRWVLGADLLNPRAVASRTYYTNSSLTNINSSGANVSVVEIDNMVGVGSGILKLYSGSPPRMSWTPDGGWEGTQVSIVSNGQYRLPDGNYVDEIIGIPGPYHIVSGINDILSLDIDGRGIVNIQLTSGVARTATNVAADINSAVSADPRYNADYYVVAAPYDLYSSGTPMIRVFTPHRDSASYVKLLPHHGADATQTLFNIPVVRGGLESNIPIGATSLVLSSVSNVDAWPDVTEPDGLYIVVGGTIFSPSTGVGSTATITSAELVAVSSIDRHAGDGLCHIYLSHPTTIAHNANELVYIDTEWPYARNVVAGTRGIVVNVSNHSLLPVSDVSDTVTIEGTGAPDGWVITDNSGASIVPAGFSRHALFSSGSDIPFDLNSNGMVSIPVPDEVLKYRGFNVNVIVWGRIDDPSRASPQSDIVLMGTSFDSQATYTYAAPTISGIAVNATFRPLEYSISTKIPANAQSMWIRVKLNSSGVGNFTIHKVRVLATPIHTGLHLGRGTIPRGASEIKQGNMVFCWSPDPLNVYENDAMGLSTVDQSTRGHIDNIAPAESWLQKFNVSEYSGSSALNVRGAFTEVDWMAGVRTNLDLVIRTPARFSHLVPAVPSSITHNIVWSTTPPYVATLSSPSDQVLSSSILLQDGIPVVQSSWDYVDATHIAYNQPVNALSIYTLTYQALTRFESAPIDLGATYLNYVWFADFHTWTRPEIRPVVVPISVGVQFDANGIAVLSERSTSDKAVSTLIEDTGLSRRIIPANQWSYINNSSIQVDSSVFNANGIYQLSYAAETNHPSVDVVTILEIKSAASIIGLASASYSIVGRNIPVDQYRYHQMRISVKNIRDVRDVRVQSILLKGLPALTP